MSTGMKLFFIIALLITMAVESNAQGKYVEVNGLRMYYEIHGNGEPLVLLHSGGSTGASPPSGPANVSNVVFDE